MVRKISGLVNTAGPAAGLAEGRVGQCWLVSAGRPEQ